MMTQTKTSPLEGKVLIVEDQEMWREHFLKEPLQELNLIIFVASTKEQALALLKQQHFNLAIVDINLTDVTGNIDGLDIINYLQQTQANTQVIVVSGTPDSFSTLRQHNYQVFSQIQKESFDLESYIVKVQQALVLTSN